MPCTFVFGNIKHDLSNYNIEMGIIVCDLLCHEYLYDIAQFVLFKIRRKIENEKYYRKIYWQNSTDKNV